MILTTGTRAGRAADIRAAIDRVDKAAAEAIARGDLLTADIVKRVRKACDKAVKAVRAR